MKKIYTGIGSRDCPPEAYAVAQALGYRLALAGFTLRTGFAPGIDAAFLSGAQRGQGAFELHLPWKGYNGSDSELYGVSEQAFDMARQAHPAWSSLNPGHQKHSGCSAHQVLGRSLTEPSAFTLCWTPDGCDSEKTRTRKSGNTATGIVISERNGIRCFNLNNKQGRPALNSLLAELGFDFRYPEAAPTPVQVALF